MNRDSHFPNHIPDPNYELRSGDDDELVIEVANHLDAHTVRGIALTPTHGLYASQMVQR